MRTLQGPRRRAPRAASQRGAVAIVVGLSLAVLVGFVGLALDGGRLYVNKTELQNAADACALAASYELTGAPDIQDESFLRADVVGTQVAAKNKVDFQGSEVVGSTVKVTFNTTLSNSGWVSAGSALSSSKFVRCTITREGILPWFMQVLGFGAQTVSAFATATLAPSQTNCAIPMAVCAPDGVSPEPGEWLTGHFGSSNGATGDFNWIDFTPNKGNEVADLLKGSGECAVPSTGEVHAEPGNMGASVAMAWNTRFGIYHNSNGYRGPGDAIPDFTGYSYTRNNWPQANGPAVNDFLERRKANTPYSPPNQITLDEGNSLTGLNVKNPYTPSQKETHQEYGADRRLVTVPIVDCAGWKSGHVAEVEHWACVLMLHPVASEKDDVTVEYVDLANQPGNPCATSGIPGNASSLGPKVPALVQ